MFSRNSPRENNRKNAENLLIKKDEPKQERVKEEKKKEGKKNEEKKKDKSKAEARKERTREKKAGGGGGGGAKPLSMQQLITQNLPASRERMVRNSDVSVFTHIFNPLTLSLPRLKGRQSRVSTQALLQLTPASISRLTPSWT